MSLKIIKSFRRESESPLTAILNRNLYFTPSVDFFTTKDALKRLREAVKSVKACSFTVVQLLQFCVQNCISSATCSFRAILNQKCISSQESNLQNLGVFGFKQHSLIWDPDRPIIVVISCTETWEPTCSFLCVWLMSKKQQASILTNNNGFKKTGMAAVRIWFAFSFMKESMDYASFGVLKLVFNWFWNECHFLQWSYNVWDLIQSLNH